MDLSIRTCHVAMYVQEQLESMYDAVVTYTKKENVGEMEDALSKCICTCSVLQRCPSLPPLPPSLLQGS